MILAPHTADAIAADIGRAVGRPVTVRTIERVGGGCIHRTLRFRHGDSSWFVKVNDASRHAMLRAEAEGLAVLSRQDRIVVPEVVSCGHDGESAWLVLQWLDLVPFDDRASRALGEGLAALHAIEAPRFGFDRDNWLGTTGQRNAWMQSGLEFIRSQRLRPQLDLACARGAGSDLVDAAARVIEALPELFDGHLSRPSLLHGDLWCGNVGATSGGRPAMFDPAPYFGDREADLAMTELFGGFRPAFHAAYRSARPLDAGYAIRRDVHNLYHLLNHFNLFGAAYGQQAATLARTILARVGADGPGTGRRSLLKEASA